MFRKSSILIGLILSLFILQVPTESYSSRLRDFYEEKVNKNSAPPAKSNKSWISYFWGKKQKKLLNNEQSTVKRRKGASRQKNRLETTKRNKKKRRKHKINKKNTHNWFTEQLKEFYNYYRIDQELRNTYGYQLTSLVLNLATVATVPHKYWGDFWLHLARNLLVWGGPTVINYGLQKCCPQKIAKILSYCTEGVYQIHNIYYSFINPQYTTVSVLAGSLSHDIMEYFCNPKNEPSSEVYKEVKGIVYCSSKYLSGFAFERFLDFVWRAKLSRKETYTGKEGVEPLFDSVENSYKNYKEPEISGTTLNIGTPPKEGPLYADYYRNLGELPSKNCSFVEMNIDNSNLTFTEFNELFFSAEQKFSQNPEKIKIIVCRIGDKPLMNDFYLRGIFPSFPDGGRDLSKVYEEGIWSGKDIRTEERQSADVKFVLPEGGNYKFYVSPKAQGSGNKPTVFNIREKDGGPQIRRNGKLYPDPKHNRHLFEDAEASYRKYTATKADQKLPKLLTDYDCKYVMSLKHCIGMEINTYNSNLTFINVEDLSIQAEHDPYQDPKTVMISICDRDKQRVMNTIYGRGVSSLSENRFSEKTVYQDIIYNGTNIHTKAPLKAGLKLTIPEGANFKFYVKPNGAGSKGDVYEIVENYLDQEGTQILKNENIYNTNTISQK